MFKDLICIFASVASLLTLCNPAWAEDDDVESNAFNLGGYSSANLNIPRDQTSSFTLNEISLILTWQNAERLNFFAELELEDPLFWNDDHGLSTRDAYFDLERLYLDYNLTEKLNIRTGRFLTPAGRWNLLHAPPLVWTATRPLVTEQLFPSSINGLMLFGSVPYGNRAIEYNLFAEVLRDQIRDKNEIIYKHFNGAHIGLNNVFGLSEDSGLNNLGLTLATFQEDRALSPTYRMIGFDFILQLDELELSGEAFYRDTNKNKDGGSGAYLQSAYHLGQEWYWLTRLETFDRPDLGSAERWLIGATKRVKPNQLLKFEFVGGSSQYPYSPRGFITSFAVLF